MNRYQRPLRTAAALAVLSVGLAGFVATPAQAAGDNLDSFTVEDTAGVLNEQRLRDALDELSFNEPTKVAVFTREGEYSDNINTETLLFARDSHPEWISAAAEDYGDYWADGYFIITLSVEGDGEGQIGTYFGEDRKVSTGQMESIHQAGYDDFNLSRWTDGVIAVADKGARIMNRPWYKQPALWWTVGIGGTTGAVTWGVVLAVRSARRQEFDRQLSTGTEHLTNVTMDLEATELAARTLPTGSRHAADLEGRFAAFVTSYRQSFTEQKELEAARKKDRSVSRGVARAKAFSEQAAELDATDDAIIAAAALYTRSSSWPEAWAAQTRPLLDDLEELPALVKDSKAKKKLQTASAALLSFGEQTRAEVAKLDTDLNAQTVDVDTALDRLMELRTELTTRLDEYSAAQIEAYAKSESEKREMQEQMRKARYESSSTYRGGSILDVTSPANLFWRVHAFNIGYSSGVSAVQSSRSAASSSSGGISSGYSGGGGSFSGSGGSSRF